MSVAQSSPLTISVALCTYNGEAFLSEQLASLESQTRPPDELVVCDDRSDDATASVIDGFVRRAPFGVRFLRNDRRLGIGANFAQAISLCRGDVIALCDQDDVWEPDKLNRLESCFDENAELLLAFSDLAIVTPDGAPTGDTQWQRLAFSRPLQEQVNAGDAFEFLLRYNVVTGASTAFRASLRGRVLPIPDGFLHDEWLALVAAATGKVRSIDTPLVRYRQHASQAIGPAANRIWTQYHHARANMGRSYFVRMAQRTARLREHLGNHRDVLLKPGYLSLVDEKLAHVDARVRMRERKLLRWPLALGEAVRGRYRRFGYGIKGFLQDLVL